MKLAEMDQKTSRNMCKNLKIVAVAFILGGHPLRIVENKSMFSDFLCFTAGNAIFSKSILAPAGSSNYGTQILKNSKKSVCFVKK